MKQEFKDFTVFLADEISYYNWLGKGYDEIEAKRRTREEDNKIRNRLYRAIEKLSISETKILKFSVLKESIVYKEYSKKYQELILSDNSFNTTVQTNLNNLKQSIRQKTDTEIAVNYFLAELPTFLNIPTLLNVPSSCCLYHQIPSFINYIYNEKYLQEPNQGFIAVNFEDTL